MSLVVLAEVFALALHSHQNRSLQTFGAKPASSAVVEVASLQLDKKRVVW